MYNSVKMKSRDSRKYEKNYTRMKRLIKEFVFENAALCDEVAEMQDKIMIVEEERKFLLRRLCQYDPNADLEVQKLAESTNLNNQQAKQSLNNSDVPKKSKKRTSHTDSSERKSSKSRKSKSKSKKKFIQPILLDASGRPIFPIELGGLSIHSLGEVVADSPDFHSEEVIYPVGFISTRIYGSLKDPTVKCIFTCKISDNNGVPRFDIVADNDLTHPIFGASPDVCHSLLLQKINDVLALNVVSTRPRGNEFFGLSHPTVLNVVQSLPGAKKCSNYKWSKFEVSKTGEGLPNNNDASLSYEALQRSINFCKYKMAPDVLRHPDEMIDTKDFVI